jgi:Kef-type K+ transport system membrane component KefB
MDLHTAFLLIGVLFLVGLASDALSARAHVPRVSILMLAGVALGSGGFDLLPADIRAWYEFLAIAALTMIAFLLGGELTPATLRRRGHQILTVSLAVVMATAALVATGLMALGVDPALALLLAGIATATDPAATVDVIDQMRAKGPFPERLKGIVAVDDGWGLVLFAGLLALASAVNGDGIAAAAGLALWELAGAALVGIGVGLPAAALTGRLRPGRATRLEALAVVFLLAGFAIWLEVSFLFAGMVAGATVATVATHHERSFHEIERVRDPFLVIFFVLAGATLDQGALAGLGVLGLGYIALRVAGRLAGGVAGGRLAGLPAREGALTGLALTPQAGVAVGMALVAGDAIPAHRDTILAVTVASTVLFELAGPVATQIAIVKAGRAG